MKKALKIVGISLASIVGLVIITVIVAVSWVTSSGRLTKMVKRYAPEFVNCEMQLEKADLTLIKTFPNIGLDISNVALINPMEGTSDTLARISQLVVTVDAKKFMDEKDIVIKKCILEDAAINIFFDEEGNNNFDVFNSSEKNDTTSSSFDYLIDIEQIRLKNTQVAYNDLRSDMKAAIEGLNLDLNGKLASKNIDAFLDLKARDLDFSQPNLTAKAKDMEVNFLGKMLDFNQIDGTLKIGTPDICLDLKENYLDNDTLNLVLPVKFNLEQMKGHLTDATITLNDYNFNLDGDAELADNGNINLDLSLKSNTLVIEDVLTYLPENVQESLSSIDYLGKITITEAQVNGTYNDSLMPLITAKVLTDKATVNIPSLPYPFTDVDLDAYIDLNLNEQSDVTINQLNAKFNQTDLNITGLVSDVTDDLALDLNVKADVPMKDIKGFLPDNISIGGRTDLNLKAKFTPDNLMKSLDDYNLNRLFAQGTLKIKNFAFNMDDIHADAPVLNVDLTLPASRKVKGRTGAFVALASGNLKAQMGDDLDADLKQVAIQLTADNFKKGFEKMKLDGDLNFGHLDLVYDTIAVHADSPTISLATTPSNNKSNGLSGRVVFDSKNLAAQMGQAYTLNTNSLKIDATANQDKTKKDFLNQWNPSANFLLKGGEMQVAQIDEPIYINNIGFLFDSHELGLNKSTFRIGQSDLSLEGNVIGIKEWIEDHKNLMKGELELTSDFLNINEILDLTSGLGSSDTTTVAEAESGEDNPFMVPEGIDFHFGIKTKKSLYDQFDLNDLSGQLTVKDGTLLLQEIGFTNKAAQMQVTAIYKSPRKNNLFLAMDFHLLDVQINDLLTMIPYIDTLVPMLKTFDGQAEFHIDAETYLKSNYQPKISTIRAAADIEGRNLTVNDKFTFTKITDMLKVSNNGEYRIDSLDVQLTAFKDEVDLWPSQIAIGKYKVTVDGRMNLDKTGEYHLSVTQSPLPTRMGLKISGPFNNLKFDIESCKYPNLYKPNRRNDTEQMYSELKRKIAESLKANVR